jgi:aspartyl-tRNA(Asn)/glutamyl-tRNA(Gln) amidotransferase subunit B
VLQETRHWEPAAKRTVTMRVKETADDYRLFPEPDLAPYDLSDEFVEGVRLRLPELPDAKKRRFVESGLPAADAANLAADFELSAFYDAALDAAGADVGSADSEAVAAVTGTPAAVAADAAAAAAAATAAATAGAASSGTTTSVAASSAAASSNAKRQKLAKPIANLLLNDVSAYLNSAALTLADCRFSASDIAELAALVIADRISSKQAKEVFALMSESGDAPAAIVQKLGMEQVSDASAIEALVDEVLAANPAKVEEYRGGKTGLLGFFVGQAMQASAGQGNPKLINEILRGRLDG